MRDVPIDAHRKIDTQTILLPIKNTLNVPAGALDVRGVQVYTWNIIFN